MDIPVCPLKRPSESCRAFTLVEMVVSIAITSVLVVGISSAIVVATRAVNAPASAAGRTRSAAEVADLIARNLSLASSLLDAQQNSICMSAFDDDGDGTSQEICYEWGGTIGDSLIRKVDDEAFTILEDVRLFALGYTVVDDLTPTAGGGLLAEHSASADLASYSLSSTFWIGQAFQATLPSGATGWKPTRVELHIHQNGSVSGKVQVDLYYPGTSGLPTGSSIGTGTIDEADLPSDYAWLNISFSSSVPTLSVSQVLWVVVKATANSSGELQYHKEAAPHTGWQMATTPNSGTAWTTNPNRALLFKVYGKVTGTSEQPHEHVLAAVRLSLATGDDESTRIDTGVNLLNRPMWGF